MNKQPIPITHPTIEINLLLEPNKYAEDRPALILREEDTGDIYGVATVNIPGFFDDPKHDVILDYNNLGNPFLEAIIEQSGIIEKNPYQMIPSGFCEYPVHRLNDKGISWFNSWFE